MKINKITYRVEGDWDYQGSQVIELGATIEPDENWEECLEQLREKADSKLESRPKLFKFKREYDQLQADIREFRSRYQKAKKEYQELVAFLIAQGMLRDYAKFPYMPELEKDVLPNILAEAVDDEDDEDEEEDY